MKSTSPVKSHQSEFFFLKPNVNPTFPAPVIYIWMYVSRYRASFTAVRISNLNKTCFENEIEKSRSDVRYTHQKHVVGQAYTKATFLSKCIPANRRFGRSAATDAYYAALTSRGQHLISQGVHEKNERLV